jgi:hypothetical protein
MKVISMFRQSSSSNTTRLFSTAGTFGAFDIVATTDKIVVDATTRNYNTTGHVCREHALANLSIIAAVRLRDILSLAIDHAASVALDPRQTALWSDNSFAAQAQRFAGSPR